MKIIVTDSTDKEYLSDQILMQENKSIGSMIINYFNQPFLKRLILIVLILIATIGFSLTSVFILPSIDNLALSIKSSIESKSETDSKYIQSINLISDTEKKVQKLSDVYINKTPKTSYIVVNTSNNHFYLYKNRNLVREGLCSTGSYIKLEGTGEQQWIFKTPRGEFKIRGKTTSPVWKKPDWAFVEEGLPIPSKNHSSRYEYGSLGDYALHLGDGYMIHGTLYQRFLGMPVTHGCVRLGDDDLKQVFTTLIVGSKVFIF
jgi:L,D-transpeptidase ErfK/SrfK